MKTKHSETIIETSLLEEMEGKYLSERLLRSWSEDFADEDTGEVISIERNEVLFDKGTFLDKTTLSELNFYLTSGDIKSVKVCDIQRLGTLQNNSTALYSVTIATFKKKFNFYLYANSIQNAIEISTDFLEQKMIGSFVFKSIKEINYSTLISDKEEIEDVENHSNENEETKDFYFIEVETTQDETINTQSFILRAKNAEDAKNIVEKHIIVNLPEDRKDEPLETTLLSAKTVSCENLIDFKFSKEYFENGVDE